jgi:hypothetical protein
MNIKKTIKWILSVIATEVICLLEKIGIYYIRTRVVVLTPEIIAEKLNLNRYDLTNISLKVKFDNEEKITIECKDLSIVQIYDRAVFNEEFENV